MHRAFYAHTTKSVLIRPICLCHDLRAQSLHPRDSPRLVNKLVPCVTADINDIVICFEDSVWEPCIVHTLMWAAVYKQCFTLFLRMVRIRSRACYA